MARYGADQNNIGFKYESGTYASATGTTLQWLGLVETHDIQANPNINYMRYANTSSRNVAKSVKGPLDFVGTITMAPQDWKSLFFAMGSCADGGSPSPYTHTLVAVNSNDTNAYTSGALNPFISFTLEDAKVTVGTGANDVKTIVGCVIDSWKYSWSEGNPSKIEIGYIAQNINFSSGAATAVTDPATDPFMWNNTQFHLPSGTVYDTVTAGDFGLVNTFRAPHYSNGSRVIAAPRAQERGLEINVTVEKDSRFAKALWDQYFIGGSEFNCLIAVSDFGAPGSRDLIATFSGCTISNMDDPTINEGTNQNKVTIVPRTITGLVNDTIQFYNPY